MRPRSTSLCPGENTGAWHCGSLLCVGGFDGLSLSSADTGPTCDFGFDGLSSSSADPGPTCDLRKSIQPFEEEDGVEGVSGTELSDCSFRLSRSSRSTLATSCGITATCESWADRQGSNRG
jgi:hypothetical protein